MTRDAKTASPINARLQTLEAAGSSFNILTKLDEKHFHGDDGDGEKDHTWTKACSRTRLPVDFWRSTPVKYADGWTTKLDATNYNTGCARPTTVAQQPLGLWRCRQVKSWTKYLYLAYKSAFQRVRAILKAPGTVKVKLWCFKGIVNPTDIHGSWGTWLWRAKLVLCCQPLLGCFWNWDWVSGDVAGSTSLSFTKTMNRICRHWVFLF